MAESHRRMFEIRAFHNARKERLFYQGKRMVWVFETWTNKNKILRRIVPKQIEKCSNEQVGEGDEWTMNTRNNALCSIIYCEKTNGRMIYMMKSMTTVSWKHISCLGSSK